MLLVFRIMMLVVIILLLLFCMSNLDSVTVRLLGWESPEMPLFLLLLFVFFFGFSLALVWQAWSGIGAGRPVIDRSPVEAPKPGKEKFGRKWGRRSRKVKEKGDEKKQEDLPAEVTSESGEKEEPEPDTADTPGNDPAGSTETPDAEESTDTKSVRKKDA